MHAPAKKAPRAAASYRGARRNAIRAAGGLSEWKTGRAAHHANQKAHLGARQVQANGAREVAAKAMVAARNTGTSGLPVHVIYASAMLDFYQGEKRTRPVNRIIRDLQKQIRA